MASASQLRSIIDSTIGAYLGNYTLPNSSQIPALWVRGSQQIPKDWKVSGTECVIDEVPETEFSNDVPGSLSAEAVERNSY